MDIFDEARQRGYRAVQNDQELPFLRERERSGTKWNEVERSTAPSIELMMIGRTLIDELFERWMMLQQPADADDARKN